jgi:hypothetical protein
MGKRDLDDQRADERAGDMTRSTRQKTGGHTSPWVRWASALRRRQVRVVLGRAVSLTLARQRAAAHIHVHRSSVAYTTIHRHLAVGVDVSFVHAANARPFVPLRQSHVPARSARREAVPAVPIAAPGARSTKGSMSSLRPFPRRRPVVSEREVAARAAAFDGDAGGSSEHRVVREDARTLHFRTAHILRRVVEERRRVEQRKPLAFVVQKPPASVQSSIQSDEPGRAAARRTWERSPASSQPAFTLDIDQLTDQVVRRINHGIIAQRERMGRLS